MSDEEVEKKEEETKEEATKEEAAKEKEEKKEYTREQQALDQEKANAARAREERDEAIGQRDELATSIDGVKGEIEEIKVLIAKQAEKPEGKIDFDNLDPDLIDPKVISAFRALNDKLDAKDKELKDAVKKIDALSKKAETYEATEAEKVKAKSREDTIDMIAAPLDKKYGVKFHNAARKLADEKVNDGKVKQPGEGYDTKTPAGHARAVLEARDLLEQCYIEVFEKDKEEASKKEKVRVDTGSGGLTFAEGEIKEGTRDEVWGQMKKKLKGSFTLPTPD